VSAAGRYLFAAFFNGMNYRKEGGVRMTLNILFMSVTFKKRSRSAEECNHDLAVFKQYEECKLKQQTFKML
jgi:uncharacterized protein (TIGR02413 family)